MAPETIHCRVKGCKKVIRGENFRDIMKKLWHHRKHAHPKEHAKSVTKSQVAKRKRGDKNV